MNPICSMTAFARAQYHDDTIHLTCEIRSINHRYLEMAIYVPEVMSALEMPLRELIKKYVHRGRIDCAIRYRQQLNSNRAESYMINTALVQELSVAAEKINSLLFQSATLSLTDILKFPGVFEPKEMDWSLMNQHVLNLAEKTLSDLVVVRRREGDDLKRLFLQRIALLLTELEVVKKHLPKVVKEQRERLRKRFTDLKLDVDPNRLEQEMVMLAQRMDIAEEVDRLHTHIDEVKRILEEGGLIGRRLDFLLQELNREANTLGSKSADAILAHAAVEMKVLIEQIREQVQNIE